MQHLDPSNWRVLGPLHPIFSLPTSPGKSEVLICCPQHTEWKLLTVAGLSKSERAVHNPQPLHTLRARPQVQPLLVRWQPPAANTPTHRVGSERGWRGCITGLRGQAETPSQAETSPECAVSDTNHGAPLSSVPKSFSTLGHTYLVPHLFPLPVGGLCLGTPCFQDVLIQHSSFLTLGAALPRGNKSSQLENSV